VKIKILPDAVINRIAAGEVVDRPVSVVRELVDNAVDAGATDVLIEIEQGGKNLIRICDDGCGMSKADVLLALERHATSKISDDADLQKIETLGFRGEALPSIAAVSRILIKTRERSSKLGTKLVAEAGTVADLSAAAMSAGTEISITSLFFNTPARKKFLKSDHTEDRQIQRWLRSYSLAHPKIRFRLILNGKESINISAANSFKDRAKQLFGERAFYVHKAVGAFLLEGYLMHPGIAPDSSVDFTVVVNNRVVSDRAIFRAVKDAYGSMLKHFESPAGVVQLTMPGWMVDVNVHPQKSEVRFRQAGEIFKLVYEATADSLTGLKASSLVSQPGLSIAVNSGGNNEVLSAALQLKQIEPQDQSPFLFSNSWMGAVQTRFYKQSSAANDE
jgi:DNA mismatch repair protein MutL